MNTIERRGFIAGGLSLLGLVSAPEAQGIERKCAWCGGKGTEVLCKTCLEGKLIVDPELMREVADKADDVPLADCGKACESTGTKFVVTGPVNEWGRAEGYWQTIDQIPERPTLVVPIVRQEQED